MAAKVPVAVDVHDDSHWWDEHPPADPEAEPLYAKALESHLSGSSV